MSELIALTIPEQTAIQLSKDVEQLGDYVVKMSQVMLAMQARLDELEAGQRAQTFSHDEVKELYKMIRSAACGFCEKYNINTNAEKMVRAAIKKDLLKKFNVKDFHDLPASARAAVNGFIDKYANIKLAMMLRARANGN